MPDLRSNKVVDPRVSELTSGNALGFLLTDTSRLFRQFFERKVAENGLGLTPGEIRALSHAIRWRGSRQAVLAERMGVEPMTLSAYLDRLEGQGLVDRRVDPADRRAKIVEPTKAAFATMEALDPLFDEIYAHVTNGMDEGEVKLMAKGLRAMRANLTSEPELLAETSLSGNGAPAPVSGEPT